MLKRVDHLVLPVTGLDIARSRLRTLGFSVAPDGIHPFGTANCCVFFPRGPYLEPLAVADHRLYERCADEGNTFVIRDRLFRDAKGEEGVSAIVVQTLDAQADDKRLHADGFSAGRALEFRRMATDSEGNSVEAGFRLAFADLNSDAFFAFACQRIAPLTIDKNLQTHENTALAISAVILTTNDIDRDADRMSQVLQVKPDRSESHVSFELGDMGILIAKSGAEIPEFGLTAPITSELCAAALVITVGEPASIQRHLSSQGISYVSTENGCVVPHEEGQGVTVVFQQASRT